MKYKITYKINYEVCSYYLDSIEEVANKLLELNRNETFELILVCDCD